MRKASFYLSLLWGGTRTDGKLKLRRSQIGAQCMIENGVKMYPLFAKRWIPGAPFFVINPPTTHTHPALQLRAASSTQPPPTPQDRAMRLRAVSVLALARLATGFISTSTTSTWVAPHDRCSYRPRRWLSRCRAQPSAAIGGGSNTSDAGGVGTERTSKPPLKVNSGGRIMFFGRDVLYMPPVDRM